MRTMKRIATLTSIVAAAGFAFGAEPAKPAVTNVVLDLKSGSFRAFVGWKTPTLIAPDGRLKPLLEPRRG